MNKKQDPKIIVIDLFCGAGGTTSGFENVEGVEVIACVNHDENAIKSHEANHPNAEHFIEDITEMYGCIRNGILFMSDNLRHIVKLVDLYRTFYPDIVCVIWGSFECTNFSRAKGGGTKNADSRTLANHFDRYYGPINPEYLMVENVVEFMAWGPLTARVTKTDQGYKCCKFEYIPLLSKNGDERKIIGWETRYDAIPNTKKNGADFLRWTNHIKTFGYHDNNGNGWKELNSADFGAYTSRNRLFGIFAKKGYPVVFPQPTHQKVCNAKGKTGTGAPQLFTTGEPLSKWKAVKDVLDFSNEGNSIFNRKKDLSDRTLERIYAGLIKFVAGGKDVFITKTGLKTHPQDITKIITTSTSPIFLTKYYSGDPYSKNITLDAPAGSITTIDGHAIVNATFLSTYNSGKPEQRNKSTECPAGTLTTTNTHALVHTFIQKYHGSGDNLHSTENPAPTIATKDQIGLMHLSYKSVEDNAHPCFIMRDFTNGGNLNDLERPAGTVMPNPKLNLVNIVSKKTRIIVNPSHGGNCTGTEVPGPVVVARQDKAPLSLCVIDQTSGSTIGTAIRIDPSDSDMMVNIKMFMVFYDIVDIKMRMLSVTELLKIQGFREDYILIGTQADKKKFIGNAVHPLVPEHIAKTLLKHLKTA